MHTSWYVWHALYVMFTIYIVCAPWRSNTHTAFERKKKKRVTNLSMITSDLIWSNGFLYSIDHDPVHRQWNRLLEIVDLNLSLIFIWFHQSMCFFFRIYSHINLVTMNVSNASISHSVGMSKIHHDHRSNRSHMANARIHTHIHTSMQRIMFGEN